MGKKRGGREEEGRTRPGHEASWGEFGGGGGGGGMFGTDLLNGLSVEGIGDRLGGLGGDQVAQTPCGPTEQQGAHEAEPPPTAQLEDAPVMHEIRRSGGRTVTLHPASFQPSITRLLS